MRQKGAGVNALLVGQKIARIRLMTARELKQEGLGARLPNSPVVLVLENGMKIYASEGRLFGTLENGNPIEVQPESRIPTPRPRSDSV